MTTPTIFSDVAVNPFVAKSEPQGVLPQQATVSIPASTASGTNVGLIRFQRGWSLVSLAIDSADLDTATNVTFDVGFLYDNTTGEDDNYFFNASTIGQSGGQVAWPSDASSLNIGTSVIAQDDGYLTITTGGGATTTAGDVNVVATFTYDLKDVA